MKKLSVEQQLLRAKYQYPARCTTYDKNGNVTSYRVVTHNIKATEELQELYPSLKLQVERFRLGRKTPYKKFSLGKLGL
tara:strand:+ start:737 stop:973 length:237 start_codon:yes stop_codon:yes gene_type:complete